MSVSIVVGGQYGSEGKGKVALEIARSRNAAAVVRVGGPNSGHTGFDRVGTPWLFRQLPASCLAEQALVILPAGSLIDPIILKNEVESIGLDKSRLIIDARASVVTDAHRTSEMSMQLSEKIGSTGSGTGASLLERISRTSCHRLAADDPYLQQYVTDFTPDVIRDLLNKGERIVIEGTQGFGLSIWQSTAYPYATSRDTTAAGFAAEAGIAPHDVDDVVMVIRTFPIRVSGNSGPFENEIDWETLAHEAHLPAGHVELTSVTRRVRRIARFSSGVVKQAIAVNRPHRIVLNHLDYIDPTVSNGALSERACAFIRSVEHDISQQIDFVGVAPDRFVTLKPIVGSRKYAN